jgi:transcriptional regulator of heat shock response
LHGRYVLVLFYSFFLSGTQQYQVEIHQPGVHGLQLIPAGGGRAMLVMLTAGGRIKSSICRLSCPADDGFMAAFYDVMHSTFIGTRLSDVSIATVQSTAVTLGSRIFDVGKLRSDTF